MTSAENSRPAQVDTTAQDDAARDETFRDDTSREPAGEPGRDDDGSATTSEEQPR
jgi:hypothetical protein